MSRIILPENKKWAIGSGEFLGSIYHAKNIDLHKNIGKILIGESLSSLFDSDDNSNLTTPIAFARTAADGTDRWWALGGRLFKTTNTNPQVGWLLDNLANSPSSPVDDMIEFAGALLVATDTNIARLSTTWTASWWSSLTGASTIQSGKRHRFGIVAGRVVFTDGRFINSYDGTIAEDPALTLPSQFEALWIKGNSSYSFIGTISVSEEEAEVFFWDGISSVYNARYKIGDRECLSGFEAKGVPYVITKRGEIKRFNNQGFETVAQFPTVELKKDIQNIDPNGIAVKDNIVMINVDFGVVSDFRAISGLWIFDADTNDLVHGNFFKNDSGRDYGQLEVAGAGAIAATVAGQGRFLVGGRVYTTYPTVTKSCIYSFDEDNTTNRAYIVTPKLSGQAVRSYFQKLFLKYRKFKSSGDRIRILASFEDFRSLPAYENITWVTSNTFTGSNTDVKVGNFVEILAGENAGAIAKITGIAGSSAPYTFTIDLPLFSSTAVSRARYMVFNEVGTITDFNSQNTMFRLGARFEWCQLLIELRGTNDSPELEEILLDLNEIPL